MSFVIGCDIGTQSTKGVLVSGDGEVMATASAQHSLDIPAPGEAEQDPRDWIDAVSTVLARLSESAKGPISHIGVAAQVDGVVATEENLEPLHPALIWMDRRAAAETAFLRESVGVDRIFEITGLNCDPSHAAPKMMWLRERLDTRPAHYLPPSSVVTAWLTGELAQDDANASSSMLFDVAARKWSQELLDLCELDVDQLPDVRSSTDVLGTVRADIAEALGLSGDTLVVTGTGDDHSAAVGAGAVSPGIVADVTGTAEPIGSATRLPIFDPERLLETHAHAVPGSWFLENPGFVSGGSVRWAADLLGVDQAEVFALAAQAPAGSKGLVFIPALSGAMSPRWNDKVRGSLTGASLDHGPPEVCRSVIEGCAFALRDNLDRLQALGVPVESVHVTGGGSRSGVWLQIKADVTGRELRAVEGEGTAVGAACLAAVAAGWFGDLAEASSRLVRYQPGSHQPDQSLIGVYEDAYRHYRSVFDALEPVYGEPR